MYVLILTLVIQIGGSTSTSIQSVPGFATKEQCLAVGKAWGDNVKSYNQNTGYVSASEICAPLSDPNSKPEPPVIWGNCGLCSFVPLLPEPKKR